MVVNSCLEHLEGRMRFKSLWKVIPQVGKRGTNEWRFTRMLLMVDSLEVEQSTERAEGVKRERRWYKTDFQTTDMSFV